MVGPVYYHQTRTLFLVSTGLTDMQNPARCSLRMTANRYIWDFSMLRPLMTYGLLTLTITGLTLFNMMT